MGKKQVQPTLVQRRKGKKKAKARKKGKHGGS